MIEASGVCEPMPIAQELETITAGKLDNVVGVVDAARMVQEFAGGDALLKKDMKEDDIESLLVQQVEFCSTLIINKKDLVTEEQTKKVRAVVTRLQPTVKVLETSHGDVPVEDIIGTNSFDFDKVYSSAGWCKALEEHEEETGEEHVHKAEGSAGSDEDEYGNSLVLETAGRQISAGFSGMWLAACPKKEQEKELAANPQLKKDWDPVQRDRMVKLCIIGQNMDKKQIVADLDAALGE